ncbi:MAG: glycosyltransferase [Candidatus Thermoplasmatota archaeon]
MQILEIAKYFPPVRGGFETYAYYISLNLSRLGHRVTVLSFGDRDILEEKEGIEVLRVRPSISISNAPFSKKFIKLGMKKGKEADVIHLQVPNPTAEIVALKISRKYGKTIVVTYTGEIIRKGFIMNSLKSLHEKTILMPLLKIAKSIIVQTPMYKNRSSILSNYESKIEIIPGGVDIKKFCPINVERDDKKNIIFVGRLVGYKGIEYLLDAMKTLKGKVPNAKLNIIGRGPLEKKLKNLAEKLKLDNVAFLGELDENEYISYLNKSNLLVLPSINREEAFGFVLLEAMACEKPVVASKVGGIPYVVEDGETGFLVEPMNKNDIAEKILLLISNPSLAETMGKKGRERVIKMFQWEDVAKKIETNLKKALEKG